MSLRQVAFGDVSGRCCASSALGDVVCSAAEYTAAANAVGNMHNLFSAAAADVQDRFRSVVNNLLATWNTYEQGLTDHWYNRNPVYLCNFKALGTQAENLAAQIATASNQAVPARDPQLQPNASAADVVLKLGTTAALAYAGVEVFKALLSRRSS